MRALRWHARGDLRLDDVAEPGTPPPGWVRLGVEACGICGTDLEEFQNGPQVVPTEPHPLTGTMAPLTLGHEIAGVVLECGDGVDLAVGTRVAVEANVTCGTCYWCRRGDHQLCEKLSSLGLMADGGLAEQVLSPAHLCFPVEDHVSPETAALAEPLAVAVRAATRGNVGPGTSVGIIGGGTIGLLLARVALAAGARPVVVVEPHAKRRELARASGVHAAVEPDEAADAAVKLTSGVGFDTTFEAAGNPGATMSAFRLARRGGRVMLLGVFEYAIKVPMIELLLDEKELIASLSHCYDTDYAKAVDLLNSQSIVVDDLVTDRVLLDNAIDAFSLLVADPNEHLKVMVLPRVQVANTAKSPR
jgi:(R,R)-butanediol dehydrogenase/meso-butanediol dehydrogenase/diacetyl reductase